MEEDSDAEDEGLGGEESDTDDVKGFTDENAAWLRPSGQKRKLPLGDSDGEEEEEDDDEEADEGESEEEADAAGDSDEDGSDDDSDEDDKVEGDDDDDEEMGVEKQARRLEQKQKKMLKESDAELRMNLAETEKFTLPSGECLSFQALPTFYYI